MASRIHVLVNNTEVGIVPGSLSISLRQRARGTCNFITRSETIESFVPLQGHPVSVKWDNTVLWAGTVDEVAASSLHPAKDIGVQYSLRCVGWEQRLDNRACWDITPSAYSRSRNYEFTVNASIDTLTTTSPHGRSVNDLVRVKSSGSLPTGLSADTDYWVVAAGSTTLRLATSQGGSSVNITDAGTGTHVLITLRAGEVVHDLLTLYAEWEGITEADVQLGGVVDKAMYDADNRVSDALDSLAELSGYYWYIRPDKGLVFAPVRATQAPFNLAWNGPYKDLRVRRSREDKVNLALMRVDWRWVPPEEQTFNGDGATRIFTLDNTPVEVVAVTVTRNSSPVGTTIEAFGLYLQDSDKKWYYSPGEKAIRHASTETALAVGDSVKVQYRKHGGNVTQVIDQQDVGVTSALETGSGKYTRLYDRTDQPAEDRKIAQSEGETIVSRYASPGYEITYTVDTLEDAAHRPDWTAGKCIAIAPGQAQSVVLPYYGIDDAFLVDSVDIVSVAAAPEYLQYTVRCIESAYLKTWVDYYKALVVGGTKTPASGASGAPGAPGKDGTAALPPPPARLTSLQWSIALAPEGDNSPFGTDSMGKPIALFRLTVTADPTDVKTWGMWGTDDVSSPAPEDLENLGVNFTVTPGGIVKEFWLDRKLEGSTWSFACVPSNDTYLGVPTDDDVIKTVVVPAVSAPGQITGFSVQLVQKPNGAHWSFTWTNPSPVGEYWTTNVEFRQTDSSWNPVAGPDGVWGSRHFSSINSFEQDRDFPYPAQTEYWQCRYSTISRALISSAWSTPINVTVPNQYSDPSNMLGANGGFEYDLEGWTWYQGNIGGAISTAKAHSDSKSLRIDTASRGVASPMIKCNPGDQFVLQTYVVADAGSTGNVNVIVHWHDSPTNPTYFDQAVKTVNASTLTGGWTLVSTGVVTAPTGAVAMQVLGVWVSANFSGVIYADDVTLFRAPASAILPAGSDIIWDPTNTKNIIDNAKVTLAKIRPGDMNSSIFQDYGINNVTKLADGVIGRVGVFTDYVISNSTKIGIGVIVAAHIASANILTTHIQDAAITDAKIDFLYVNKLKAGTANFTGPVTFQYSGGAGITIGWGEISMNGSGNTLRFNAGLGKVTWNDFDTSHTLNEATFRDVNGSLVKISTKGGLAKMTFLS